MNVLAIRQSNMFDLLGQTSQDIIRILIDNHNEVKKKLDSQAAAIDQLSARTKALDVRASSHPASANHSSLPDSVPAVAERDATNTAMVKRTFTVSDFTTRSKESSNAKFQSAVLRFLYFEYMTERQDDIAEAHKRTFQWVYSDSPNSFRSWHSLSHWLRNEQGLYWMNGKAGSGKSTLMKYLYENERTQELLSEWSQDMPCLTAAYFAWNAGDRLQNSQEGLLRSLLYDCLSQCGALAPLAFPRMWKAWENAYETYGPRAEIQFFDKKALQEAIVNLVNQKVYKVRLCFIVDGLDEYVGEHRAIADLFRQIAVSQTAKALVSSRPLLVFEHSFRGFKSLTLQDLTYDDIKAFVKDRFKESSRYTQIQAREPEQISELEEIIVGRSSGVFLWVKIVVDSLLEGLMNYDRASDLKMRVEALPTDLEALYFHMFQNLDPIYLDQASRLFQIALVTTEPLSPLVLALADEEDPDQVYKAPICIWDDAKIEQVCKDMEGRLKSRCKGLLEIQSSATWWEEDPDVVTNAAANGSTLVSLKDSRVEWLHKTVPDYLKQQEIWALLRSRTDAEFRPNVALLKSYILLLKVGIQATELKLFGLVLRDALRFANACEASEQRPQTALLNELFSAVVQKWKLISAQAGHKRQWQALIFSGWLAEHDEDTAFLILCIIYGLFYYVQERLRKNRSILTVSNSSFSLLRVAILPNPLTIFNWRRDPRLIRLLLEQGADPNIRDDYTTPWEATLNCICHDLRRYFGYARWPLRGEEREIAEQWFDITFALVSFGAKPRARSQVDSGWNTKDDYEASGSQVPFPLWVVRETFTLWLPEKGAQLEELIEAKLKKKKRNSLGNELKKFFRAPSPRDP
jgi:hypothetical protein